MILAIDPGPEESGWVKYNTETAAVVDGAIFKNEQFVREGWVVTERLDVVIEQVEHFGMPVGRDVFETVFWSGRLFQEYARAHVGRVVRLTRREVKLHLCNSVRAKDANVRQALIDRFGPGKEKAIGKKASPGPLYGIKSHMWSALALAVTFHERREEKR